MLVIGDKVRIIDPGGEIVVNDSVLEDVHEYGVHNYYYSPQDNELLNKVGIISVVNIFDRLYFIQLEDGKTVYFTEADYYGVNRTRTYLKKIE